MRSYNNLYEPMLQNDYIVECFKNASKKKKSRSDVKDVLEHLDRETETLKTILCEEIFIPDYHEQSIVNDGSKHKTRRILKPHYKYEQVVHHCAIGQFKQIVMNGLYEFSCGSIPDRGVHYGKKYMRKWLNSYDGKKVYVLKMDVRHFFESINREILKEKLRKAIRDRRFLRLLCIFIEHDRIAEIVKILEDATVEITPEDVRELVSCLAFHKDEKTLAIIQKTGITGDEYAKAEQIVREHRKGVPLGYFTSQWFGNFYLKVLDHYIKEKLGAEHYMRYMDDMVILGKSKKKLHRMREEIARYLKAELDLELKGDWQVFRFEYVDKNEQVRGRMLDFMGFQFHHDRTTIRKTTIGSARKKAYHIAKNEKISWYNATVMLSYLGWFKHTDTYEYYLKYIKPNVNVKKLKRIVSKHSRKELEKLTCGYCTKGHGDARSNYHCWGGFWKPIDGETADIPNSEKQCYNCKFSIFNAQKSKGAGA
ncbi:MAG: RNA-directed DNA polymerase [Clostridiales bacterium]|nr:RNA-directed DNA polymerase [Clostridiales bacterium]